MLTQLCAWFQDQRSPNMTHSTALSSSASSNMMRQLLPPSSIVAGRRFEIADMATRLPVAVLPVKATLATAG